MATTEYHVVRAMVLKAEREYSNLLVAAKHFAALGDPGAEPWKYLLNQIVQDTRTRVRGHPRKTAVLWMGNIQRTLLVTHAPVFSPSQASRDRIAVILQLVRNGYSTRCGPLAHMAEKSAVVMKVLVSPHLLSLVV